MGRLKHYQHCEVIIAPEGNEAACTVGGCEDEMVHRELKKCNSRNELGGNMKMSDYVREWAEAFKEPDPDPIEEKAMQILETAKPVPIQIPERLFDKERIKELEKDLIRAEAERDVFQKLYKEQLAIS